MGGGPDQSANEGPALRPEVGRLLRNLQRIERLGDHLQLAGARQIVEEGAVEDAHELLRVAGAAEVGDRDGGFFAALPDRAHDTALTLRVNGSARTGKQ